jgi:hypothetical protein
MGQPKLIPSTNVTSLRVARVVKGEVNYQGLAKAKNCLAGTVEPPLPLTPQRLELIKKYLNDHLRRPEEPTATRIPESVAPRAQAVAPADAATLTGSILALLSRIRTLAAVLVIVALLPNLAVGALLWLIVIDPPSSKPVATSPNESAVPEAQSIIHSSVITAPTTLQATAGERTTLPIAIDGAGAVPGGSIITISGLPRGSTLSTGRPHGETEWKLEPGDIGDLHLMLPKMEDGEAQLRIRLLGPAGDVIADTATMLKVTDGPEASIPIHKVKTQPIHGQAWEQTDQGPNAGDVKGRLGNPEARSTSDLVPLPTRRPEPPSGAASDNANWIKPSAFVNLRNGPKLSAPIVGVVARGTKLRVKGRTRGWVEVTNPATSQEGWIYGGNVETSR